MKYHWNTQDLLKKLSGLGQGAQATGFGGDYDTNTIEVSYNMSKRFYIQGWDPEKCLTAAERDDVDVGMITCYDGQYQDQAVSSADPNMIQLYADIFKVLKKETKNTETGITHHYKQFF